MKVCQLISLVSLIGVSLYFAPCKAMLRIPGRFPSAVSAVRVPVKPLNFYSSSRDFSKGCNFAEIQPVIPRSTFDVANYIPQDLTPTNDGGMIAARIADRSLNTIFNSPEVQNTDFGRTAHSLEKTMNSDMSVGGQEPDSIRHNFKFGVKAAQTKAHLTYEGITNAEVSYQVVASTLNVEVREPMAMLNTDLVYNHINTRDDQRDVLSVRWNW